MIGNGISICFERNGHPSVLFQRIVRIAYTYRTRSNNSIVAKDTNSMEERMSKCVSFINMIIY